MKYKVSRCPDDSFRVIELEVTGADYVEGESTMEESKFDEKEGDWEINDDDNDDDDDDEGFGDRSTMLVYVKKDGDSVTLGDFDIKGVIGWGTFGKVFLAEFKRTK